jgi:hypothetical protein
LKNPNQQVEKRRRKKASWLTDMMSDGHTKCTRKIKTSLPVSPHETRDGSGKGETKDKQQGKVPAVLPLDEWIILEVRYVGAAGTEFRLEDNPADVGPE